MTNKKHLNEKIINFNLIKVNSLSKSGPPEYALPIPESVPFMDNNIK